MPTLEVTGPKGEKLSIPYEGQMPTEAQIQDVWDDYEKHHAAPAVAVAKPAPASVGVPLADGSNVPKPAKVPAQAAELSPWGTADNGDGTFDLPAGANFHFDDPDFEYAGNRPRLDGSYQQQVKRRASPSAATGAPTPSEPEGDEAFITRRLKETAANWKGQGVNPYDLLARVRSGDADASKQYDELGKTPAGLAILQPALDAAQQAIADRGNAVSDAIQADHEKNPTVFDKGAALVQNAVEKVSAAPINAIRGDTAARMARDNKLTEQVASKDGTQTPPLLSRVALWLDPRNQEENNAASLSAMLHNDGAAKVGQQVPSLASGVGPTVFNAATQAATDPFNFIFPGMGAEGAAAKGAETATMAGRDLVMGGGKSIALSRRALPPPAERLALSPAETGGARALPTVPPPVLAPAAGPPIPAGARGIPKGPPPVFVNTSTGEILPATAKGRFVSDPSAPSPARAVQAAMQTSPTHAMRVLHEGESAGGLVSVPGRAATEAATVVPPAVEPPLPSGLSKVTKDGKTFYVDKATGEMLPAGARGKPHPGFSQPLPVRAAKALGASPSQATALFHKASISARKGVALVRDVANIPRSAMFGGDLGAAPMRQGMVLGSGNPITNARAFNKGLRTFGDALVKDGAYGEKLQAELARTSDYALGQQKGLSLTRSAAGSPELAREEGFQSKMAERIPVLGRVLKAGNEATSVYMNHLRVNVFGDTVRGWEAAGLPTGDKELHALADYINTATGRADLGKLEKAAPVLTDIFASPRLQTSRAKLLNPATYLDPRTPIEVRKLAAKNAAATMATSSGLLALAQASGATVNWTDPTKGTFLKAVWKHGRTGGSTSLDFTGGFSSWVVFASREATAARNGDAPTAASTAGTFAQARMAPTPGLITEAFKGTTYEGQPFEVKRALFKRAISLYVQDVHDAYRESGPAVGTAATVAGGLGAGVNTFTDNDIWNDAARVFTTLPGLPATAANGERGVIRAGDGGSRYIEVPHYSTTQPRDDSGQFAGPPVLPKLPPRKTLPPIPDSMRPKGKYPTTPPPSRGGSGR